MLVFLDTCTLVPEPVRRILLEAATADLFTPLWSDKIFQEWQFVALKSSKQVSEETKIEILLMKEKWSTSLVPRNKHLEDTLFLPDHDDRHVLAAAITGQAEVLLTNNLRDFPVRICSEHGLRRQSIDSFLWQLFAEAPELIDRLVDQVFDARTKGSSSNTTSKRSFLKKYGLSRLAKCITS